MNDPQETVEVCWCERPTGDCVQKSDTEWVDVLRLVHYVWWRQRWCIINAEQMLDLDFNELDWKLARGTLGLVWRKVVDS